VRDISFVTGQTWWLMLIENGRSQHFDSDQ
jgi:hypothetical protein